ncbi:CMT1A duplicated region transcript 4 protein [Talpa occidentalis]|uniref:CMT1A duplicated region transcript 4 protein n=1 Tax=Talpa occidentalis TaxID=50954 RepID=UPI0018906DF5|nr:CMT1A duplicated region transcript 4 protein [Talpa occidentalis]
MSLPGKSQGPPYTRSKHQIRSEPGVWSYEVRKPLEFQEEMDAKKVKTEDLPKHPRPFIEKCNVWPAYVTYIAPVVISLIEKSKARELEFMKTLEESRGTLRPNKPLSTTQMKRRKLVKLSDNLLKDVKSGSMLSVWDNVSRASTVQEPTNQDARDGPTANYNKIIFSRKPMTRILPYSSLLASKEKH